MSKRPIVDQPDALYATAIGHRPLGRLAIFVHGYDGDYRGSWGDLLKVLAEHADSDPSLSKWDYCFIGYETLWLRTVVNVADEISFRVRHATTGVPPFVRSYEEIALIGHSLGTLAIRYYLLAAGCSAVGSVSPVTRVMLIGQPVFGSSLADFLRLLGFPYVRKPVLSELAPGSGFALQLRKWGHCVVNDSHHPALCPIHVYSITSDIVANPGQSFWQADISAGVFSGDHQSAIKVRSAAHSLVSELKQFLA